MNSIQLSRSFFDFTPRVSRTQLAIVIVALFSIQISISDLAFGQTKTDLTSLLELRLAEIQPADGLIKSQTQQGDTIYLHPEVLVREDEIASAKIEKSNQGALQILIEFNKSASRRLEKATAGHLKKPMAILFEGSVISAPLIHTKVGRWVVVTGNFSKAEANEMLKAFNLEFGSPNSTSEDSTNLPETWTKCTTIESSVEPC